MPKKTEGKLAHMRFVLQTYVYFFFTIIYLYSGHVTMTAEVSGFFKQEYEKCHRWERFCFCLRDQLKSFSCSTEMRRNHGMLNHRPYRNPVMAERTPRIDYSGYDFSIPPALPETPKWKYPDVDWGLMEKFPSQKKYYDKLHAGQREYEEKLQNFKEMKEKLARSEEKAEKTTAYGNSPPPTMTVSSPIVELPKFDQSLSSPKQGKNNDSQSRGKPKNFYEQPISSFKSLGKDHPEMLASWRAKRAANFLETKKDLTAIPEMNVTVTHGKPFRPCGADGEPVRGDRPGSNGGGRSKSTKDIHNNSLSNITQLERNLQRTQEEIKQQEMKIRQAGERDRPRAFPR